MNMLEGNGTNSVLRSRKVSLGFGLLAAAAFLLAATVPALAARPVPSLDVVPADAAFYSAMLRSREQFDAIVNSKAFAKLKALPYVQMGLGLYSMQAADPNSPLGKFEAARRDPELKRSFDFLADIFSDEIFVYGGSSFNQAVELIQGAYGGYYGGSRKALSGELAGAQRKRPQTEELQGRVFVRALVNRIDLIKFPDCDRFQGQRQGNGQGAVGPAGVEAADGPRPGACSCRTA